MDVRSLETVIWDFNGTLIDDLCLAVRSINVELERRGLPLVTVASYREVFAFPMADYYVRLGFDLTAETMEGLADEFHETYLPGLPSCPLHEGVADILEALSGLGIAQYVLSAMEEETLRASLKRLGIARCFQGVYGLGNRLADSKLSRGRDLVSDFQIAAETALFIGDTDHDLEVANALGTQVVLVAQGHQSAQKLRALGSPVFATFHELRQALVPLTLL